MNYFQAGSIVFGIILITVRLTMHVIPEKWNQFELNRVYTEKRPQWVWLGGFISMIITGVTWYKQVTTEVSFSIAFTLIISLTLVKVWQVIFNYNQFRAFAIKALTEDRTIIIKINIFTTVLGVLLIVLGVWVY
ncbi:hypothetical protein SAMN05518684_10938 [Salipaludibacillus aurantiacus]|uniref:Copper resistance protein D n=2 Tax=Salipaludibacillus aurantiacus TaxID=1601833 RepID=A0A1H9V049_9BACI|nr:hypothetical protein SAMN05518684_10938 [Salipaludibacillus aurantiacus]